MGRELALCYEEKVLVYGWRGALGSQEELFKPARMEVAAATEARWQQPPRQQGQA